MNILLREICDAGIVEYGDFTLNSGQKSNFYINCKNLTSFPKLYKVIVHQLKVILNHRTNYTKDFHIAGVPFGAIPLACGLALDLEAPLLLIRPEKKEFGTKRQIEGRFRKGDGVVLVEDVVTTGGSVKDAIKIVESHGLKVIHIVSIFNRSPTPHINPFGDISYNYLYNMKDLQNLPNRYKSLVEVIEKKKTNIIFSCDLTRMSDVISYAELCGEHICILKIHSDIIEDFSLDGIRRLREVSIKYNFFIMEDRKFADIGSTLEKQLNGPYKYTEWCDYVTVYPYVGETGIELFKKYNIGVFIIAELSIDRGKKFPYKELYDKYCTGGADMDSSIIVGTIGQNNTGSLQATPGVSLTAKKDDKNQKYVTPLVAKANGADLLIVGRGIYESNNVKKSVMKYKKIFNKLLSSNNIQ